MSAYSFPEFMRRLLESGLEYFGCYYGIYRAMVIDNEDPSGQGKLKIKCATVHGDQACEVWAYPMSPWASNGCGLWAIPDKDEYVYVVFDHGRPDAPIWCGSWWGTNEKTDDMTIKKVVLATKEGMKVVLDRTTKTVLVEQASGNSVLMSDSQTIMKHNHKVAVEAPAVAITGSVTIVGDVSHTGNYTLTGDYSQTGNGNVQGNWYATNNSAHHTHPVVLSVAVRNNP